MNRERYSFRRLGRKLHIRPTRIKLARVGRQGIQLVMDNRGDADIGGARQQFLNAREGFETASDQLGIFLGRSRQKGSAAT